jgi:hypothetical protein
MSQVNNRICQLIAEHTKKKKKRPLHFKVNLVSAPPKQLQQFYNIESKLHQVQFSGLVSSNLAVQRKDSIPQGKCIIGFEKV